MSEIIIFIRNFTCTLAVISIPLLILWLIERYKMRRVEKSVEDLPEDLKEALCVGYVEEEVSLKLKMKYAMRNMGKGVGLYVFCVLFGMLRTKRGVEEIKEYLMVSLVILAFILLFVLRDALRVAPWVKLRVVKAVEANEPVSAFNGDRYILYYDILKGDFEASKMEIGSNVRLDEKGCLLAVVAEKRKRLRPIFVI